MTQRFPHVKMRAVNTPFPAPFDDEIALITVSRHEYFESDIHPEERSILSSFATPKRRSEFFLGRAAARRALRTLGISDSIPVLKGSRREPLWPDGIVGSITHTSEIGVAAASASISIRGIGIDLQKITNVTDDALRKVLTPSELAWISSEEDRNSAGILIFAAKESLYKALSPIVNRYIGFHEAEVAWNIDRTALKASLCRQLREECKIDAIPSISLQRSEYWVFTAIALRKS